MTEQFIPNLGLSVALHSLQKTLGTPMDNIKEFAREQAALQYPLRYPSIPECVRRLSAKHGVLVLWRGNLAKCLIYALPTGSILALNDLFSTMTNDLFVSKLVCGGAAGAIGTTVSYPLQCEYLLYRHARVNKQRHTYFKGIGDCIVTIVSGKGIGGGLLYPGWVATVMGSFVFRAGQLGGFRQMQDNVNPYKNDRGVMGVISSFVAVTLARLLTMPFTFPFTTVRRRFID